VPTFTCGLLRSNFSLAMSTILVFAAARGAHSALAVWLDPPLTPWRRVPA
jgi:hypothetical protein